MPVLEQFSLRHASPCAWYVPSPADVQRGYSGRASTLLVRAARNIATHVQVRRAARLKISAALPLVAESLADRVHLDPDRRLSCHSFRSSKCKLSLLCECAASRR